jgi:transglutaminase-like putative cysteine protease
MYFIFLNIKRSIISLALLLLITCFVLPITTAKADEAFIVDAKVVYKVKDTGRTLVTHEIGLENIYSTLYATTYTLSLENIDAQNITAVTDKGNPIKVDIEKNGTKTNLKLMFDDAVVGKGSVRNFTISYENGNFATKTGEVWEISIPKLSGDSSFRNYQVDLHIPDSFGQEAYVSPQPLSSSYVDGNKIYSFSKQSISTTGVTAGFGHFQVFSFNLSYHLENPLAVNSQTEIAIPPDTAFQKIYFNKIEPKPNGVRIDEDGNWLALYKLTPRQRIDVNLNGFVQIFASFRSFPKPSQDVLNNNLVATNFWQVDDGKIRALAKELKTPQAIYDYVANTLKYDTSRVQPNVQRMGAATALENPNQAICMEFSDLFIAIARAAGIPAREINGYAYTENPLLQPLSLVNDVLHAWPEYYDKEKGVWIPIDPTWGSTSGVDYFNKLDLRHFTFVIHGKSDKEPYPPGSYKLGTNPQKDVFVSFGSILSTQSSVPQMTISTVRNIPFFDTVYSAKIYNPGPSALDSFYRTIYFDGNENSKVFIQILPPYATYESQIKVPFSLLGKDTPDNIEVVASGSHVSLTTNKSQVVLNSLLVLFILFIVIMLVVLIRFKKIDLWKIYWKVFQKFK